MLALDQLADADPRRPRAGDSVWLSGEEWARLGAWIAQRSDRHVTADGLIGRSITPGLTAPMPPEDEHDAAGAPVAA